jgi:hypothetical protein
MGSPTLPVDGREHPGLSELGYVVAVAYHHVGGGAPAGLHLLHELGGHRRHAGARSELDVEVQAVATVKSLRDALHALGAPQCAFAPDERELAFLARPFDDRLELRGHHGWFCGRRCDLRRRARRRGRRARPQRHHQRQGRDSSQPPARPRHRCLPFPPPWAHPLRCAQRAVTMSIRSPHCLRSIRWDMVSRRFNSASSLRS